MKTYKLKYIGKQAYLKVFDTLGSIADMNHFNTDSNWIVLND